MFKLVLNSQEGIIFAASDYIRSHTDQIRPYINKPFYTLGTDGFGRSDTRKELRKFFEVDKKHIVTYTLSASSKRAITRRKHAEKAIKKYNIDQTKVFPTKI